MAVNIRFEGDVAVLSNFGRLMNDPRHFDAGKDVGELLDQGYRKFVLELKAVNEMGDSGLGLLITITRLVRRRAGEVVLVSPSRSMQKILSEMQLDDYWDVLERIQEADDYFKRNSA